MHDLIDPSASENNVVPATAQELLERFCRSVGGVIDGTSLSEVPAKIADILPELIAQPGLLSDVQRQAPVDSYGRNRVFICPQDKFSVLAMVWPAGVTTPIHDHRDWCTLGVYEGVIEETYFDPASDDLDCTTAVATKTVSHRPGAIAHLPVDAPNIHCIHNPTDEVAISIHVYGGNCETLGPNLGKVYSEKS